MWILFFFKDRKKLQNYQCLFKTLNKNQDNNITFSPYLILYEKNL